MPRFATSSRSLASHPTALRLFLVREAAHIIIKVLPLWAMAPNSHVAVALAGFVVSQWAMSWLAPLHPFLTVMIALLRFSVLLSFNLEKAATEASVNLERVVGFALYMAMFRDLVNGLRMGVALFKQGDGVDWPSTNMCFRQCFLDSGCNGLQATIEEEDESASMGIVSKELFVSLPRYAGVGMLCVLLGHGIPNTQWLLVWLSALLKCAGALVFADVYDRLCPLAVGVVNESFFKDPFAANTVAEFWSRHYNLSCHAALKACVYRPLVKKMGLAPPLGVVAVFFVSGAWHLLPLPFFVPKDKWLDFTTSCMLFFLLQGANVVVEKVFGLKGKIWVWCALLLPSPLFLESFGSVV